MRTLHCLLFVVVLATVLPDSIRGQTEADSTAQPDTTRRAPDPRTALLLGLIPGGGQIYNRAWLKALLVIAAEGYYADLFRQNRDNYRDYKPSMEHPQSYYLELRNKYAWRFVFVYILGLLDGYVDAHLSTFPPDTSYQAQPLPPSNQSIEEGP